MANNTYNTHFASTPTFGRKKDPVAAVQQDKTAATSAAPPPAADKQDTDMSPHAGLLPLKAAAPSNNNQMATAKASQDAPVQSDDEMLSPFLDQSYKTIWSMIKKSADFRRYATLSKDAVFEDMLISVQEVARIHEMQLSDRENRAICTKILDEMMGLGPIEPLLLRDEVTEIMVNGPKTVYLELNGIIERSAITFRDNDHLVTICQRIAAQVGRRADESSPMCDARLPDGSRVNMILPPLALDGAVLTIRKFQKERLTLEKIQEFGSVDETTAEIIRIIAACRVNILVSGGTGSGKTTLLNCITRYINPRERIVTCEDAAELQLQQPHVVRLETRPASLEGGGEVTMRDLVKNCLRMRPDRIVVGEVRGPEAFDLLQAMNTGHDGSMGTVHANNPRDAVSRLENMIAMARLNIPAETIRQQIASSVNVIVQIQRLKDGSRRVMSVTEITGMEGEVISMQDLIAFHIEGQDSNGRVVGHFRSTGLRPRFAEKLRQFNMEKRLLDIMEKNLPQR